MPGSTGCTRLAANRDPSSRQLVGRTHGASSSIWRGCKKRRSRWRRPSALMRCLPSSARSTLTLQERCAVRAERSRPLVIELETWLREQRARVSKSSETGKAIDYSLKRWTALRRFLDDGRLCMSNNAAERELRAVAVGRRNWTFAGSDEGGRRAAAIYTLIQTAKLNDIDPQAWLADVLARPADPPPPRTHRPPPWKWLST